MSDCYAFEKRIIAFVIDSIILTIIGMILCKLLYNQLLYLGNLSILIGFFIFVLYYGLQNSSICNGQTIGKRIAKIEIVSKNGEYLSPWRSIIRSMLLTPILIFNDITIPLNNLYFIFNALISALSIIQLALFIFNRPTRQMLHDLVIGSVCINKNSQIIPTIQDKTKLSAIIIIPIILSVIGVFVIKNCFTNLLGIDFISLNKLNNTIEQNTLASIIGVNVQKRYSNNQIFTGINYTVTYPHIDLDSQSVYSYELVKLANEIIKNEPETRNYNQINITILQCINIGIFKFSKTRYGYGTIQQWEEGFKHYNMK